MSAHHVFMVLAYAGQWFHSQVWPFASAHGDNKADKQRDEKLNSAVKPVFIWDPATVPTARGQHTVSFMAVTLMIREDFRHFQS